MFAVECPEVDIVEQGDSRVIVVPACTMGIDETCSVVLGEIDEAILNTTDLPDRSTCQPIDIGDSIGVGRRDQIITLQVFLEALKMKPVPRISTRAYQDQHLLKIMP